MLSAGCAAGICTLLVLAVASLLTGFPAALLPFRLRPVLFGLWAAPTAGGAWVHGP